MGQLVEPVEVSTAEYYSLLWTEFKEGTIIWRDPTKTEQAERRERRAILMRDSHVPWIVSDVGSVLQFFDDVQDILALATWNKALVVDPLMLALMDKRTRFAAADAIADIYKQSCRAGRPGKRGASRLAGQLFGRVPKAIARAGLLGTLRNGTMWGLLAGQVLRTATGVGVSLGAAWGAIIETAVRVTSGGTALFERGTNKWHQYTRARALKNAERGLAALPYLPREDSLTGIVGWGMALHDLSSPPEYFIDPKDYPTFEQIYRDPFGLMQNIGRVVGTFPSNAARYVMHDVLGRWDSDLAHAIKEEVAPRRHDHDPLMAIALRLADRKVCPDPGACRKQVKRFLKLQALADRVTLGQEDPELGRQLTYYLYGDFRRLSV